MAAQGRVLSWLIFACILSIGLAVPPPQQLHRKLMAVDSTDVRPGGLLANILNGVGSATTQAQPFHPFSQAGSAGQQSGSSTGMLMGTSANVCTAANGQCRTPTSSYCLHNLRADCAHDNNIECEPCSLYRTHIAQCSSCTGTYITTRDDGKGGKHHHLVVPTHPVSGVEAIFANPALAKHTDSLWDQAFSDALATTSLGKATLVLAANPMVTRTQHQLHIHVAAGSSDFLSCIGHMNLGTKNTWVKPTTQCTLTCGSKSVPINIWAQRVDDSAGVSSLAATAPGTLSVIGDYGMDVGMAMLANPFSGGKGKVVVLWSGDKSCINDHTILDY